MIWLDRIRGYTPKLSDRDLELLRLTYQADPDPHDLARALQSKNLDILINLAKHPKCPNWVFEKLVNHKSIWVRQALAANPALPYRLIEDLSQDINAGVKINLAQNPGSDIQILEMLYQAKSGRPQSPELIQAIASNQHCSPDLTKRILQHYIYASPEIELAVANNPNAPSSILIKLALRLEWEVGIGTPSSKEELVKALVSNPNMPPAMALKLAEHQPDLRKLVDGRYSSQTLLEVLHNGGSSSQVIYDLWESVTGQEIRTLDEFLEAGLRFYEACALVG